MNRLFSARVYPRQGAVYRDLTDPYKICFTAPDLTPIPGVGCSTFPVTSNNYGALPQLFPLDEEIDEFGYDDRFSSLSGTGGDPDFTNMWWMLGAAHRTDIFAEVEGCFCPGVGIDRYSLTIGSPKFPQVSTLPFVRVIQAGGGGGGIGNFRENNAVDKTPGNCCPGAGEPEEIKIEVVGGELRLVRKEKQETPEKYRTTDVSDEFLAQYGFPRWCCLDDPCDPGYKAAVWEIGTTYAEGDYVTFGTTLFNVRT